MSEYKVFSKKLYEENDNIAKSVAIDFLQSTKRFQLEVPVEKQIEMYKKQDFEILFLDNHRRVKVEVERKKVWTKEGSWQGFPTIDVPARKNKSESNLFIMVNYACNTLAITLMKNVLASKVSSKRTIYTNNEEFFNVDLSKFRFYHKCNNKWKKINPL